MKGQIIDRIAQFWLPRALRARVPFARWILTVHCTMSYLWKFEPDIPDNLWAMMLWKFEILRRMYWTISTFDTQELIWFWWLIKGLLSKLKGLELVITRDACKADRVEILVWYLFLICSRKSTRFCKVPVSCGTTWSVFVSRGIGSHRLEISPLLFSSCANHCSPSSPAE